MVHVDYRDWLVTIVDICDLHMCFEGYVDLALMC